MKKKSYQTPESVPVTFNEPTVAYRASSELSSSNDWNPNVPFHGTQEEWWEHFHRIEEGEFMTIEEADIEFELWKKEFLASKLK